MKGTVNGKQRYGLGVWVSLLTSWLCFSAHPASFIPLEPTDQTWRTHSFTKDAKLEDINVFNITFESSPVGSSNKLERVWLATSSGLHEFDGYRWTRHGVTNGLPSDFVRSVKFTRARELWVGTDKGAGVYSGKGFDFRGSDTQLSGQSVRRIVEDGAGTLWFCSDPWPQAVLGGGLTRLENGRWTRYGLAEGLPGLYVVQLALDAHGTPWAVTKQGVAELEGDRWVLSLAPAAAGDQFSSGSFALLPDGTFVFSSGQDLFFRKQNAWERQSEATPHKFGLAVSRDGKLISTRNPRQGLKHLVEWTPKGWSTLSSPFEAHRGYCEDIAEDPEGNVWVVGYGLTVCWRRNAQWREFLNIPPVRFADGAGRVWFGRDASGPAPASRMVRMDRGRWEELDSKVDGIRRDSKGVVWGWRTNAIVSWTAEREFEHRPETTGLSHVFEAQPDLGGRMWFLGGDAEGKPVVAWHQEGRWQHRPAGTDQTARTRSSGSRTGAWFIRHPAGGAEAAAVHFTETGEEVVPIPKNILSEFRPGLESTPDDAGLWLYGDTGLHRWSRSAPSWTAITNIPGHAVVSVLARGDETWVASSGATGGAAGLARLRSGLWTWFPVQAPQQGMIAEDQTMLFPVREGFLRVDNSPDAKPQWMSVPEDLKVESVIRVNGMAYWIGTDRGNYLFTSDTIPPATRWVAPRSHFLSGEPIRLQAESVEKFRPAGHRKDPQFSWKLDDGPWSDFSQRPELELMAGSLKSGRHTVWARARDSAGEIDPNPTALRFTIEPEPWQTRPWFAMAVLCTLGALAALTAAAMRARGQLTLYAQQLEKRVAERTAALESELAQKRETAKALRQSEERFSKAFHSNPAIIAISSFPEAIYMDVNETFVQLLGYAREEVIGRSAKEVGVWEFPAQRAAIVESISEGRRIHGVECTLLSKSGRRLTVLASVEKIELGGRACLLFINNDITERKESEAVAAETQERLRQLAESIHEGFWLSDARTRQLLYLSSGFERIWGRDRETLLSTQEPWLFAVHPEDHQLTASFHPEVNPQAMVEYRILRQDGALRWVRIRGFQVKAPSGEVSRIAGIAEDITERRQLEIQFRQAQKMEALGTLSGGIAHDFNNILGAVFGNIHLSRMDLEPGHPALFRLTEIEQAANRAKALVRQILAFSRQQPPSRKSISLQPIIHEVNSLLRASIPAGIDLITRVDTDAPNVFADAGQIHQVLLNLGTNSWQAMVGDKGRIEIRLSRLEVNDPSAHGLSGLKRGEHALVEVSDNGSGMDASTLEHIFEPFFTTKEIGRGTGLGLSVVHGIVQAHDGAVRVISKPGTGTTFSLYFPAVPAETTSEDASESPIHAGHGQRILLIDDESALANLASTLLRRLQYKVESFVDPAQGLAAFQSAPGRFDLVITDLHMPGMSGLDVLQVVRKVHPRIPVVVTSGLVTESVVNNVRSHGVSEFLQKPSGLRELSEAVWRALNSTPNPTSGHVGGSEPVV